MRICILFIAAISGCGAASSYTPYPAGNHLLLGYDQGLTVSAGDETIATEPRFVGLEEAVGCVPAARGHARRARRHGRHAFGLAVSGGVIGATSLGGLAGLAYVQEAPSVGWALLGSGLAAAALGLGLAAGSRRHRTLAIGNAVDAVNYYNDARRAGHPGCR